MTVVLQMSDPHFGTERPMAVGALERLCGELKPDLLLITGDITQRARPIEFSACEGLRRQTGRAGAAGHPGESRHPALCGDHAVAASLSAL
ncbi:hypothetical protein ACFJIX_12520 [Roseateles sp. UC29_93]|uniref:hypothetical protein n=1 Tax=Roseateles sp. UC29_93 TaxID=3350177 RepID=UPI00366DCABB